MGLSRSEHDPELERDRGRILRLQNDKSRLELFTRGAVAAIAGVAGRQRRFSQCHSGLRQTRN